MPNSQNGYPVLDGDFSGPHPRLRNWHVPGAERDLPLRDGSTGFLLVHLATWFNRNIEKIDTGFDDWGWSPRQISGSSEWSNHASGTAIDLNAAKHPQGVSTSHTFSAGERDKIHQRLRLYQDCIKWGGDYQTTPDAMHYEIDRGLDAVVRRAKHLCNSGTIGREVLRANPGARTVIYS
jgi:hypothetical protein